METVSDCMDDSMGTENHTASMTVEETASWLKEAGIPEKFCDTFTENYVDGESFLSLTEQDIKDIIPPIGIVKKILKLQQGALQKVPPLPQLTDASSTSSLPLSSPPSTPGSSASRSTSRVEIPEYWRPEVEGCIQNKCLDDSARCEIVRTLVCLLFSRYSKPDRSHCGTMARQLILRYPFMKDVSGKGYQSWEDRMVERIRNAIKNDRKRSLSTSSDAASVKRCKPGTEDKKKDCLLRRYPSGVEGLEDCSSTQSHVSAITTELQKANPRDTILLPLMMSSYHTRRLFILHEARDVRNIFGQWPALKRQALVEQELELITGDKDCKSNFLSKWKAYYLALLRYAETSGKKSIENVLKHTDEANAVQNQVCALKVLTLSVGARGQTVLPYIYKEYNSDVVAVNDAACDAECNNAPRIAAMVGDEKDYILGHPDSLKRPSSYVAVMSDLNKHL